MTSPFKTLNALSANQAKSCTFSAVNRMVLFFFEEAATESYAYFRSEFAEQWKNAPEYINRAVKFYSDFVGDYPHPHASAVMANGGYEGGMEYPMITVLAGHHTAQDLDVTIAHEVGHNWFQGILGSNERDNAWMDEGLNSYYDHRYTLDFYG